MIENVKKFNTFWYLIFDPNPVQNDRIKKNDVHNYNEPLSGNQTRYKFIKRLSLANLHWLKRDYEVTNAPDYQSTIDVEIKKTLEFQKSV